MRLNLLRNASVHVIYYDSPESSIPGPMTRPRRDIDLSALDTVSFRQAHPLQFGINLEQGLIPDYHIPLQKGDLILEKDGRWHPSDQLANRVRQKGSREENNLDDPIKGGVACITGLEHFYKTPEQRKDFVLDLMSNVDRERTEEKSEGQAFSGFLNRSKYHQDLTVDLKSKLTQAERRKQLEEQISLISRNNAVTGPHLDNGDSDRWVVLLYEPTENVQPGSGCFQVTDLANAYRHGLLTNRERMHEKAIQGFTFTIPEFDNSKPFLAIIDNRWKTGLAHSATPVKAINPELPVNREIYRLII